MDVGSVSVPRSFFANELRMYGNWREAFARELLQNAVDAGARTLRVSFASQPDGALVSVVDDGCGMSRDVLLNVFFALGETTKHDAGTIGGFGRARIITCFAQRSYTIRSGDLAVSGSGGSYRISPASEPLAGCRFDIVTVDDDVTALRAAFERLLARSSVSVPVLLDSAPAPVLPTPARARRALRDEVGPWARVFVCDGPGMLNVRVAGLSMFHTWIAGTRDVILELVPSRSRDVLVASRDGLREPFAAEVERFVADVTMNERAALRVSDVRVQRLAGGGWFSHHAAASPPPQPALPAGDPAGVSPSPAAGGPRPPVLPPAQPSAAGGLGFDVFVTFDAADRSCRVAARRWRPDRLSSRRVALLLAWRDAVAANLAALSVLEPQLDLLWTVGLVFDHAAAASHQRIDPGHVFSLNPVRSDGRAAFSLSSRQDRQRLVVLAAHEVSHVLSERHDERFAVTLTELCAVLRLPPSRPPRPAR